MDKETKFPIKRRLSYSELYQLIRDMRDTNEYTKEERREVIKSINRSRTELIFGGLTLCVLTSLASTRFGYGITLPMAVTGGSMCLVGVALQVRNGLRYNQIHEAAENARHIKSTGLPRPGYEKYTLDSIV
ncbi:MAG: hypothetical protein AABX12_03105 [Nanoarchaeota archaeon]